MPLDLAPLWTALSTLTSLSLLSPLCYSLVTTSIRICFFVPHSLLPRSFLHGCLLRFVLCLRKPIFSSHTSCRAWCTEMKDSLPTWLLHLRVSLLQFLKLAAPKNSKVRLENCNNRMFTVKISQPSFCIRMPNMFWPLPKNWQILRVLRSSQASSLSAAS